MSSRFTEQETESYYDAEDAIYRTIWDEDGSVHWGYFDETTGTDFLKGCANLDRIMVEKGRIGPEARLGQFKCVEFVEELMYGHLRKYPIAADAEAEPAMGGRN